MWSLLFSPVMHTRTRTRKRRCGPSCSRPSCTPELEQGSGVVVPLVLARHALHVAPNFNDAHTQNQKQCKLSLILLTTETKKKYKALTMLCGNTQAMTRLCGKHTKRWRETQPTRLMNADSNQRFAEADRTREKRIKLLAAAAATDRLVIEERTTTKTRNNKCVLTSVSCVMAVAMLALRPREHTRSPHIEDVRVQKKGALQPRLVPLRVHEGGVRGPAQKLFVEQDAVDVLEQDAVDVLHCGSTQNGSLDQNMAMRVQC